MQSRKIRFTKSNQKKWPVLVIVAITSVMMALILVWIGMHSWSIDKSISALNLDYRVSKSTQVLLEPAEEKTEDQTQSDQKESDPLRSEEPRETEIPDDSTNSPEKKSGSHEEKPEKNTYILNQEHPTSPTIENGIVIANKRYPLPTDYNRGEDPQARAAFNQMAAAAKLDGFEIVAFSTFRSYERQQALYNQYVAKDGQEAADQYSARPGYSEHQTGLAFDIGEKNFEQHWASPTFGQTPAGKWLAQHAHLYGFILRYPLGKEDITGYMHESWHYRYVGVKPATEMYTRNQTLEEYLDL